MTTSQNKYIIYAQHNEFQCLVVGFAWNSSFVSVKIDLQNITKWVM